MNSALDEILIMMLAGTSMPSWAQAASKAQDPNRMNRLPTAMKRSCNSSRQLVPYLGNHAVSSIGIALRLKMELAQWLNGRAPTNQATSTTSFLAANVQVIYCRHGPMAMRASVDSSYSIHHSPNKIIDLSRVHVTPRMPS